MKGKSSLFPLTSTIRKLTDGIPGKVIRTFSQTRLRLDLYCAFPCPFWQARIFFISFRMQRGKSNGLVLLQKSISNWAYIRKVLIRYQGWWHFMSCLWYLVSVTSANLFRFFFVFPSLTFLSHLRLLASSPNAYLMLFAKLLLCYWLWILWEPRVISSSPSRVIPGPENTLESTGKGLERLLSG